MATFITVTVLWVFSVCLHEFGHAIVAYYGGDTSVREKGYLTLNPLRYTHPVYSLVMPVVFVLMGGIGLPGGAVYIDHKLLRSRGWETGVSLAGPAVNVVLIGVIGVLFSAGLIKSSPENPFACAMAFLMQLQIGALFLNLLPVPPLDGFQALAPWLPEKVRERAFEFSNVGMFGLFIALWYIEPFNDAFWSGIFLVSNLMGVDPQLGWLGFKQFQFWK